jgi:hypothetical protein
MYKTKPEAAFFSGILGFCLVLRDFAWEFIALLALIFTWRWD